MGRITKKRQFLEFCKNNNINLSNETRLLLDKIELEKYVYFKNISSYSLLNVIDKVQKNLDELRQYETVYIPIFEEYENQFTEPRYLMGDCCKGPSGFFIPECVC